MSKKFLTSLLTTATLMAGDGIVNAKPVHEMTQEEVRKNITRIIESSPEMSAYADEMGIKGDENNLSQLIGFISLGGALLGTGVLLRRNRSQKTPNKRVHKQDTIASEDTSTRIEDAEIISYTSDIVPSVPTIHTTDIASTVMTIEDGVSLTRKRFFTYPGWIEHDTVLQMKPFFSAINGEIFICDMSDWIGTDGVFGLQFRKEYTTASDITVPIDIHLGEDPREGLMITISIAQDKRKNYLSITSDGFLEGKDRFGKPFKVRPSYGIARNPTTQEITILVGEGVGMSHESQALLSDDTFAQSNDRVTLFAPYLF